MRTVGAGSPVEGGGQNTVGDDDRPVTAGSSAGGGQHNGLWDVQSKGRTLSTGDRFAAGGGGAGDAGDAPTLRRVLTVLCICPPDAILLCPSLPLLARRQRSIVVPPWAHLPGNPSANKPAGAFGSDRARSEQLEFSHETEIESSARL